MPARSVTLTLSVPLPVSVTPARLQLFWPMALVAVCQVVPLLSET